MSNKLCNCSSGTSQADLSYNGPGGFEFFLTSENWQSKLKAVASWTFSGFAAQSFDKERKTSSWRWIIIINL